MNIIEQKEKNHNIIAFTQAAEYTAALQKTAAELNIPYVYELPEDNNSRLILSLSKNGLSLLGNGITGDNLELRADFTRMLPRLKTNNLRAELLIKAAKPKSADNKLLAVDATAGFGEDSLLLAAAGYKVQLFEYNSIIAALLKDALLRAQSINELKNIVSRMTLCEQNSLTALPALRYKPDIILLDPMFPERQKSALVKKKFQLLQHLELPCTDGAELMAAAIAANPKKIIVKRPSKGPFLANKKPGYSIEGTGIRYDCYPLAQD